MQGTDWEAARRLTREWLQEEGITPSRLAGRASVQRSVVSRFLNGQPITSQTAARLCDAMQPSLSPAERVTLLEAFGLSRFSQMAALNELSRAGESIAPWRGDHLFAVTYTATILWHKAITTSTESWLKALPLFFEAERAFGLCSTAAIAGLQGVQILINIGDFDSAEREVIRIQTVYAGEMDTLTRSQVATLRGWIAFDRGEFGSALRWFRHNIHLQPNPTLQYVIDGAHHFTARTLLEMSRQQTEAGAASRLLHDAEQHMNTSLAMKLNRDAPLAQIGFDHLRMMEILDAQGRHDDARAHRHKASEIFAGAGADLHIALHVADQNLDEGDTKGAVKKGMAGLEGWREYANGFARAAGIVAQGKLEEDKPAQALRYAALAHAFNPRYAHHSDRPKAIDLAYEASRLLAHQGGRRKHDALVRQMKEDAQSRAGEFAHLARAPVDHTPALLALCDQLLR
jgi:plasmid maintenance system antidote protein VapI